MVERDELRQVITHQIDKKRVAAARARRLANELSNDEDRARTLRFADELDAQADELLRALSDYRPSDCRQPMVLR
jgi:hypothetical protein